MFTLLELQMNLLYAKLDPLDLLLPLMLLSLFRMREKLLGKNSSICNNPYPEENREKSAQILAEGEE